MRTMSDVAVPCRRRDSGAQRNPLRLTKMRERRSGRAIRLRHHLKMSTVLRCIKSHATRVALPDAGFVSLLELGFIVSTHI